MHGKMDVKLIENMLQSTVQYGPSGTYMQRVYFVVKEMIKKYLKNIDLNGF